MLLQDALSLSLLPRWAAVSYSTGADEGASHVFNVHLEERLLSLCMHRACQHGPDLLAFSSFILHDTPPPPLLPLSLLTCLHSSTTESSDASQSGEGAIFFFVFASSVSGSHAVHRSSHLYIFVALLLHILPLPLHRGETLVIEEQ